MSVPSHDPAGDGRVLSGKYRLGRRLGAGGMGEVYEARHVWTRRRVAVKLLHADLAARKDGMRRFFQEARAAARIAHPNIVDVLDMGSDDDGTLYLVHELLDGDNLREHLARRGRLPLAEALDLLIPLMGALAAAHERGIVHRDLKPSNVLLARSPSGELVPKLIDFGISKVQPVEDDEAIVRTDSGMIVGTAAYMSPEQVNARRDLDGRTDVWALGVMLYELLSGERPFDGESTHQTMTRVLTEPHRPLPDLPAACRAFLDRSLAKDPGARFPTVRAQLEAALAIPTGGVPRERHERSLRPHPVDAAEAEHQAREEAMPLETLLASGRAARRGRLPSFTPEGRRGDSPRRSVPGGPVSREARLGMVAVAAVALVLGLVLAQVARSSDAPPPPAVPVAVATPVEPARAAPDAGLAVEKVAPREVRPVARSTVPSLLGPGDSRGTVPSLLGPGDSRGKIVEPRPVALPRGANDTPIIDD